MNVENCIRTLSEVAKARAIAIPSDLDMKVIFNKIIINRSFLNKSKFNYFIILLELEADELTANPTTAAPITNDIEGDEE